MLINGYTKLNEINEALMALWYEPEYQWYFAGRNHYWIQADSDDGDERNRIFASTKADGKVIGCMGYAVEHNTNAVQGVFAIRFPDGNKLTFGRDLRRFIDDIFIKFGFNRAEFGCIVGNPAERMYDKHVAERMGGRVLCVERDAAADMQGNLHGFKRYEIMRDDYMATVKEARE